MFQTRRISANIKFCVHLPVMGFDGHEPSKDQVISAAQRAEALGYDAISVNDHILFNTGWLDAISSLATAAACTSRIKLATSVLNIVVRNPVVSAKALAGIDIMSAGRFFAGVGPGSHRGDYEACGIPFEERWPRFSEALEILISLLDSADSKPMGYSGKYYAFEGFSLSPKPIQRPRLPIHIGSWGSDAGLRRVAKYADGWMASAYNITPAKFKEKWNHLLAYRKSLGKDHSSLENSIMTMFGYIDEDDEKVSRVVRDVLSPALGRPAEDLKRMLLFGSSDDCIRKVREFADSGVQRIHFWPVKDYVDQIRIFKEELISEI
jgi:alkanesulfonate monooxygenase SsuD/methylene tetrahydromethanopterin reductase-like flavin-dependent oxidoreductase (luciferase family)